MLAEVSNGQQGGQKIDLDQPEERRSQVEPCALKNLRVLVVVLDFTSGNPAHSGRLRPLVLPGLSCCDGTRKRALDWRVLLPLIGSCT
jgi:hypothetical protein